MRKNSKQIAFLATTNGVNPANEIAYYKSLGCLLIKVESGIEVYPAKTSVLPA